MLLLVLLLLHAFCLTTITITITTAVLIKRGGGGGGGYVVHFHDLVLESKRIKRNQSPSQKRHIYIEPIERDREREKPRQSMQSAIDLRWRKA